MLSLAVPLASANPLEGTFLDIIDINGGTINIGDRPESDPNVLPNNGTNQPAVTINLPGPLSGVVTGQFEASQFVGGGWQSVAQVAAEWDLRWGLVDVTSVNPAAGSYVTNGAGDQIFSSTIGNEGFTAINLPGSPAAPLISWIQFQFDLASEGLTLVPGHDYAIFVLLDRVSQAVPFPPGSSLVPLRTNGQPLDPSQLIDIADGLVGGAGIQQLFESQINAGSVANMDKIATSVIINVIPEPATIGVLALGAFAMLSRRRTR
jgi:hypothetical protein